MNEQDKSLIKSDEQLRKFSECMLSFTADPQYNINLLTRLCGEILGATCSLYNRLQGTLLCSVGQWNPPEDYISENKPDGHICYDVIKGNGKDVYTLINLPETSYYTTDQNVAKYKLMSYAGKVVRCAGVPVGSLCAVFQHNYDPDTQDKYFISLIASAIGVEEERKLAQDEIMKYATELHELNQSKDKFFSIISHDLKGPFNAIMGFSDILTTEWTDYSDEERRHFIRNIHTSAKNTFRLLENLLEWAMAQTGKLTFNPVPFDLSVIANEVVILMREQAENKQIKLFTAINFNTIVLADENMIRTILRNLVSNAIKYTQEGGQVKILGNEIAATSEKPAMIQVCVHDTGIGIDPKILPKLFRIDEKVRSSGTAQEKGTGLGLILCRELIEKNGGKIWVESELDHGSRFCFTVPGPGY
jgi:signal transduction histidine kinase